MGSNDRCRALFPNFQPSLCKQWKKVNGFRLFFFKKITRELARTPRGIRAGGFPAAYRISTKPAHRNGSGYCLRSSAWAARNAAGISIFSSNQLK